MFICSVGSLFAQNVEDNTYGVPDEVYLKFKNYYQNYQDKTLLFYADTLQSIYNSDKNEAYKLMAYELKSGYYFYIDDDRAFFENTSLGKELAKKLKIDIAYFTLSGNEVTYNLYTKNRRFNALQQAKALVEEAKQTGSKDCMYISQNGLGTVYQVRRNFTKAIECYTQACDLAKELSHRGKVSISILKSSIALCYLNMYQFEQSLQAAKESYELVPEDNLDAKFIMANCYYSLEDKENFMKMYDEIQQELNRGGFLYSEFLVYLDAYKYILTGEYESALNQTEQFESKENALQMKEEIYAKIGAYDKAYTKGIELRNLKDSLSLSEDTSDVDELNSQLDTVNEVLRKTEIESSLFKTVLIALLIVFVMFVVFLYIHFSRRKKNIKELNQKNIELQEAKEVADTAKIHTEKALEQARQANTMKTHFIANVSHEIRTPLNAISGFTQLLLDPNIGVDELTKSTINAQIQQNVGKLTLLINNVLELSSLDSNAASLEDVTEIECNTLIQSSVYSIASSHNIQFLSDLPDDYQIKTSPSLVTSIIQKLIDNAVKFGENSPIVVGCSIIDYPGNVAISVEDQGPGIQKEDAEVIFDRFKKLSEFTAGFGLGLSICRAQAEMIGGQVFLDTTYTHGAKFILIIPR
ncbi:MAG: tetratricopeptide repeat-containing sensor histidine kinase [Bacteroidaceae bacterium]|nr:tetratricopeptide repeat-containing sensor histidine kinase [Bacteroidaceae bacterium]